MPKSRAPHGTESGYRRHLADSEPPCQDCCAGHAEHNANWRNRARVTTPDHPLHYQAARLGNEPAEALTTRDRQRLVTELHTLQWADHEIAAHTRMTTYTTARIRGSLGLAPHQPRVMEGVA